MPCCLRHRVERRRKPPVEVRRYVQPVPERGGGATWRTIVGFFLLGILTIVGGVVGGLYLAAHEALNDVSAHTAGAKRAPLELKALSAPERTGDRARDRLRPPVWARRAASRHGRTRSC